MSGQSWEGRSALTVSTVWEIAFIPWFHLAFRCMISLNPGEDLAVFTLGDTTIAKKRLAP